MNTREEEQEEEEENFVFETSPIFLREREDIFENINEQDFI